VAVLATDIGPTGSQLAIESLVASQVHSVLCVPLMVHDKLNGCIYLDSSSAATA
jgi:hypothetical protein